MADRTRCSWVSLPPELRLEILEEISRQKYHGWASCAAVCKEWQAYLEPKNFQRLQLQTSCVEELKHMVVRQRSLVQHIWLDIQLPRHCCRYCQGTGSLSPKSRYSGLIQDTILKLFSILSTWQPAGPLMLELSTYSPSEWENRFRNLHSGRPDENDGGVIQPPRLSSPLSLSLPGNLPEVQAVTGLMIRQQLRQQMPTATIEMLWERLPRLESIIYDPWRVLGRTWKTMCDEQLASVIQDAIPSHVKTISIFEDFNDQLVSVVPNDIPYLSVANTDPKVADPKLVRALTSKSHSLEHLAVSYMIDAQQFFNFWQPSDTWQNLQSLTLTSSILTPTTPKNKIYTFLCDASLAALSMPRLENMVIWNSVPGEACAIIHHKDKENKQATITWRSTWDLQLSHDVQVVESWQKVASDAYHLQFKTERLYGVINSYSDAIYHLRLPNGVIDPVALWQIRKEGTVLKVAR